MLSSNKIYIVAGNRYEAERYARHRGWRRNYDFVFVKDFSTFLGAWEFEYMKIGGWKDRSDIEQIEEEIKLCRGREVSALE